MPDQTDFLPDPYLHHQHARHMKQWNELKAENSWTLFKVMAEFVEGFERLNRIGPCISIFGSARTHTDSVYYQLAEQIGTRLTEEGFGIITGGGPGIMEAGSKGAFNNGGVSVGLNIDLPFETNNNQFIDRDKNLQHRFFFIRKVMFVKYAQGFIAMPGGFGTLDELFEVLTLIQTKKISKVPIVLVGVDFWSGLRDWIREVVCRREKNIIPADMDLMPVTDDVEEVVRIITEFYAGDKEVRLRPNYDF